MQPVSDPQAKAVVAANLRRLRGEKSLSEVGRLAETSAGAIRDIEHGLRMPGIGLLTRLADAFGVTIEEFLKPQKKTRKSA
jgi:transcriptional regulator with XRE-family HTH domain